MRDHSYKMLVFKLNITKMKKTIYANNFTKQKNIKFTAVNYTKILVTAVVVQKLLSHVFKIP